MKIATDIVRHEFIGTNAEIKESNSLSSIGIFGRVVDETRNTFTVLHERKRRVVPKETSTIHFAFSDGTVVEINGKILIGKPEDRLKKTVRRLW